MPGAIFGRRSAVHRPGRGFDEPGSIQVMSSETVSWHLRSGRGFDEPGSMHVMSSEAVGWHLPAVVTLDDLAAMNDGDEFHRYEISPEGVLSVMPPPEYAHALVAGRLMM